MIIERKTALITGAASGIDRATVERFSADHKYLPIYAIDKAPTILKAFPGKDYPSVVPRQIDLSVDLGDDYWQSEAVMDDAFVFSGRLDVVVNAAGTMVEGDPWILFNKGKDRDPELDSMHEVNLGCVLRGMIRASLLMKDHGGGVIINITSAKHFWPDVYHLKYMQDKAMLSRITRHLAGSYREEYGVRLVDVQPGNTKTNIDRGSWVNGNNQAEIEVVSSVNNWWRKYLGNDPKNVADVIYEVAEGKRKGSSVYVGLDTQIGRALYLVTYPTLFLRSDMLFFYGSIFFYKALVLGNLVKRRFSRKNAIQD